MQTYREGVKFSEKVFDLKMQCFSLKYLDVKVNLN